MFVLVLRAERWKSTRRSLSICRRPCDVTERLERSGGRKAGAKREGKIKGPAQGRPETQSARGFGAARHLAVSVPCKSRISAFRKGRPRAASDRLRRSAIEIAAWLRMMTIVSGSSRARPDHDRDRSPGAS
jgi:hypothetical protein